MDSLRAKSRAQQPKVAPPPPPINTPKIKPLPKREELFISREEALQMEELIKPPKNRSPKSRGKKITKIILLMFFFALLSIGIYLLVKTYVVSKKMNTLTQNKTTLAQDVREIVAPILPINNTPLHGEENGRINILLLGAAGEHKPGGNLTDTVMIMSINTKTNKIALLSLPRDFYVPIPGTNNFTKLNSLYPIGIKENQGIDFVQQAAEKITGLAIDYYLAIDFDGFQKIIDDIGGVNITNERDIYDPSYPGPNYSYQTFKLSKGFHTLDGATALEYVRERHDDPQGDFGRAKRQQQVIQAVKNKMFSLQTFFNVQTLNNVLDTLGDNIRTNITFDDIDKFISLSKKVDLENIDNVVVDAWKPESLMKVSHVDLGGVSAFILVPRVGNYSEIQDLAQNIFDQNELKNRAAQISNEDASILIVNASDNAQLAGKIKTLLSERLNMKNVKLDYAKQPPQQQTTVTDLTNGQKIFTLDELVKKIPAKLATNVTNNTNSNADFVITLGSDIVDSYNFDDVSKEDYDKAQTNLDFQDENLN